MNSSRYQELLGRLLEGELAGSEIVELGAALKEDASLGRDLRQHLVLWDAWSQSELAERSSEAFLSGLRSRLQTLEEPDAFARTPANALEISPHRPAMERATGRLPSDARRGDRMVLSRRMVFAALFFVVTAGLAGSLWLGVNRSAQGEIVIRGDAVCAACDLNQGHEHFPAIKVSSAGSPPQIYFLEHNRMIDRTVADMVFCGRPTPVIVKGTATMRCRGHDTC